MKIMYLYKWPESMKLRRDVRMSSGEFMNINKDRTDIHNKMCAGLLVTVPEDIFHAEDCVDFKLGVAKARQGSIRINGKVRSI